MIYLMRHGADCPDRYGGWSEYGLTDEGIQQVHNAKMKLADKNITEIYASDLFRAKQTAEIISAYFHLPVTYLPQFREVNNGYLAGMLKSEASHRYPGLYWRTLDWTQSWPGGESPEMFYKRIKNAWQKFKDAVQIPKYADKDSGEVFDRNRTVLLISHGGVMNIILCIENGIPYTNKETHYKIGDAEIICIK